MEKWWDKTEVFTALGVQHLIKISDFYLQKLSKFKSGAKYTLLHACTDLKNILLIRMRIHLHLLCCLIS